MGYIRIYGYNCATVKKTTPLAKQNGASGATKEVASCSFLLILFEPTRPAPSRHDKRRLTTLSTTVRNGGSMKSYKISQQGRMLSSFREPIWTCVAVSVRKAEKSLSTPPLPRLLPRRTRYRPLRSPSQEQRDPHGPRRTHLPPYPHRRTSGRTHASRT